MNKMIKCSLFLVIILTNPYLAFSTCVQKNNTVTFAGVDSATGNIYINVAGHDNGCGCNYFRYITTNTDVDRVYATILTAISLGKKIRVDANNVGECNTAYRAYLY